LRNRDRARGKAWSGGDVEVPFGVKLLEDLLEVVVEAGATTGEGVLDLDEATAVGSGMA